MKNIFLLTGFCITLLFLSGCSQRIDSNVVSNQVPLIAAPSQESTTSPTTSYIETASANDSDITNAYSNPIDAYFIPLLNNYSCEVELRDYQDAYVVVWRDEYKNVMKWMYSKCVYQEDKDNLSAYENSVSQLIESTETVSLTNWSDIYKTPPKKRFPGVIWGNGTRSALNQLEAEIYRDASMRFIDKKYNFLKRDYSAVEIPE